MCCYISRDRVVRGTFENLHMQRDTMPATLVLLMQNEILAKLLPLLLLLLMMLMMMNADVEGQC